MNFKDGHEIQVMLSKHLKGKAPPEWGKTEWKNFYKTFKRTSLTPYQLAAMIWQGYSFTPVYRNGRRLEENFVAAWHLAFDFDGEGAALDTLMQPGSLAWTFASFAYSTPSSTERHPKSRVVFVLGEPIMDTETVRLLHLALAWVFLTEGSVTDRVCKDPIRLFYGSPNCDVRPNWSILYPPSIESYINQYLTAHPPKKEVIDETTVSLPPSDDYVENKINVLLEKIVMAPDGEKHDTLNRIAYTIGGMVGGGHLSALEAESKLEAAIMGNGRAKNLDGAKRTITDAVSKGQEKPITLENKIKKYGTETL